MIKASLLIVLSLSALALAGPALNKNTNTQYNTNNQIDASNKVFNQQQQQQQQYNSASGDKQTQATEILKHWCFASQMSQPELTSSFKKLVSVIKSSPEDQTTESIVMSERICQGALVQKSSQSGQTVAKSQADAQAHELIKDVYMDALIACEKRECTQQLIKIINSQQVDTIRASYYMTRIAVTEKDAIKDTDEIKQLADSFCNEQQSSVSEAVERQKLFAITSLIGKSLKYNKQTADIKQTAQQVASTIVERYIKPVSQQEVQQYQQQHPQQQQSQLVKKIAKRNAAIRALCNIPGWMLKEVAGLEETIVSLASNKQELVTVRQSAIECLEQNESAIQKLKQIAFDQEEPVAVRIAAYRSLMTVVEEPSKQQVATEIVDQVVKHCEDQRNQQQDEQFVLYAISHLDNIRTSQQPEYQTIKECIQKNKQHNMQIQLLCKKFKSQLSDVRKYSRNYKLEQEFNQLESGLVIEGDLIYESAQIKSQSQSGMKVLPQLIRVNMSMPVMGETVNVVEITVRQNNMDEELLSALKLVQGAKFNSESVSRVVDSFKSNVEQQQQQQQQRNNQHNKNTEADLTIKVDGCTIVYLCVDDFKTETYGQRRNTRSMYSSSIVDDVIEYLKRKPVAFNRGFNFNLNQRLAKLLDVEANVIAGLRFDSRAQGSSSRDFEIVAHVEPRVGLEAVVGPAKVSSKKLLQRFSTKTALGLRLRFKQDELVDVQIDLPMNTMELFTFETQLVERSSTNPLSYTYLPQSVYGQEDIYTPSEDYMLPIEDEEIYAQVHGGVVRKMKRSIFSQDKKSFAGLKSVAKLVQGKTSTIAHSMETSERVARATGLRGKLRFVASPKDMSLVCSCIVQKYEPSMQGYRVKVQKVERNSADSQKQYLLQLSTPGSRVERTMQIRLVEQSNGQRSLLKTDIQSPQMAISAQYELIHDGRLYAIKAEAQSTRGKQWRHLFECGIQQNSNRLAGFVYKPYLNIDSSKLRRPMQLQGVVSYQQSPKSVISYELKCPTSGDFVQGKIILDSRTKRTVGQWRQQRSMRSPLEFVLDNDITFTSELVGQVQQQLVKVHKMLDWDSQKFAIQTEMSASHKNLRKSAVVESQVSMSMKLDKEQQAVTVSRKCPQDTRKEFRFVLASEMKSSSSHQLLAELRSNKRSNTGLQSVVAYKHKLDFDSVSPKKMDVSCQIELIDTERQINEKLAGRARFGLERSLKTVQAEMSSRDKLAKIEVQFVSLKQHNIELVLQASSYQHKTLVRADQRTFTIQSKTIDNKRQNVIAKLMLELLKGQDECQLVFELPSESCYIAADLKVGSGKVSSLAVRTKRFSSKGEFTFETLSRGAMFGGAKRLMSLGGKTGNKWTSMLAMPLSSNMRFKTDLKDSLKQEAYWLDSKWNAAGDDKSYLRFDSPIYRSELEFEPRQEQTRFGMFARSKRSIYDAESIYASAKDSPLYYSPSEKLAEKLGANKMWMLRSILSSPTSVESLKQKARSALFEYADRRQSHKHQMNWSPMEERVNFAYEHEPASASYGKPMRLTGDWSTAMRPSSISSSSSLSNKLSFESDFGDFDLESKPFDGIQSFAKLNAVSRHRRSPFKKHESEYRYKKDQGYKAFMKHQDSKDKHHKVDFESDESPKKWAKMSFESDKHGKGQWEHKWRKSANKRSTGDDYFANQMHFSHSKPTSGYSHETSFEWEEPISSSSSRYYNQRIRRDTSDYAIVASDLQRPYSTYDYLKHVNARLNSSIRNNNADLYKIDFDYQPTSHARLNVHMPEEMLHSSSLEYQPSDKTYKLSSRLMSQSLSNSKPSYEFLAQTKPVIVPGLATAEQEPVFFNEHQSHPLFESQSQSQSQSQSSRGYYGANNKLATLFRQPLKVDYNDIYGRTARFDYDQSPLIAGHYAGLRQKRAAVYYKDDSADFEHESTYDFYPEIYSRTMKPSARRVPGDVAFKTQTKYGPVVVRVESDNKMQEVEISSPLVEARVSAVDTSSRSGMKLIKVQVDNKQQKVQLNKIIRKTPVLRDLELVQRFARKFDSSRFEHQSELLVGLVEAIFKVKSSTLFNERPVLLVEGEFNKSQDKAYVKIDGERTKGRLVVDLVRQSAELVMDVDEKRTVEHVTRIVRLSDKFYSIESQTSYEKRPLYKLSGKISSLVFSEPEHLFASRRVGGNSEEHISNFVATIYEPKHYEATGVYDCMKREARVVLKDLEERKVQENVFKFDESSESIIIDSRLSSPHEGQVYVSKVKLSLPGLSLTNDSYKCHASNKYSNKRSQYVDASDYKCSSEVMFAGRKSSNNWVAKYQPGEYVSVNSPLLRQTFSLY